MNSLNREEIHFIVEQEKVLPTQVGKIKIILKTLKFRECISNDCLKMEKEFQF